MLSVLDAVAMRVDASQARWGADEARELRGEVGPRTRGHGQAISRLNRNQVTLPAAVQVSSQPNQISLLNYLPNP